MSQSPGLLHDLPGTEVELLAFKRVWHWRRLVEARLPEIVARSAVRVLFQPIFELSGAQAAIRGYEALARFPVAPEIPVGMWFRAAWSMGLGPDLELVAARRAAKEAGVLTGTEFLAINTSLESAIDMICQVDVNRTLVLDISCGTVGKPTCRETIDGLRSRGAQIAIDDIPLDQVHDRREELVDLGPEYVKVDSLAGVSDDAMARFNLAEAATWCREVGIGLVAERVETPEDLAVLYELGVQYAQGYSLSEPLQPTIDASTDTGVINEATG